MDDCDCNGTNTCSNETNTCVGVSGCYDDPIVTTCQVNESLYSEQGCNSDEMCTGCRTCDTGVCVGDSLCSPDGTLSVSECPKSVISSFGFIILITTSLLLIFLAICGYCRKKKKQEAAAARQRNLRNAQEAQDAMSREGRATVTGQAY